VHLLHGQGRLAPQHGSTTYTIEPGGCASSQRIAASPSTPFARVCDGGGRSPRGRPRLLGAVRKQSLVHLLTDETEWLTPFAGSGNGYDCSGVFSLILTLFNLFLKITPQKHYLQM
jgi:hypothetical protein